MEGKINKYGFVHIGKAVYEELGLSRKTEIPLNVDVDAKRKRIVLTINTGTNVKSTEEGDKTQE